MTLFQLTRLGAFAALATTFTACSHTAVQDSSGSPVPIESYSEPYHLAPLDTIKIAHNDGHVETIQVTIEDKAEYPDGQSFHAIGRTPAQVSSVLKDRDATISTVNVMEFKGNRISVTGEVNIQTNFDLQDAPMRVLDAVASAGGFTPLADTSVVRLIRHTSGKIEVYQLNLHDVERGKNVYLDMLLQPGDHIFVPKSLL